MSIKLNDADLQVIFDVLNVYDPNDISHVYPEMGEEKFMREVQETWLKVLNIIKETNDHYNFKHIPAEDYTSDGNGFLKKA